MGWVLCLGGIFIYSKWGFDCEKYKPGLSPLSYLQIILVCPHKKEKEKKEVKRVSTKKQTFILLENISMLHTSEIKGV